MRRRNAGPSRRLAALLLLAACTLACHSAPEPPSGPASLPQPTGGPDARPLARAAPWDLSDHEKLHSQGNEKLVARHFFGDRRDGVFVDVGSYHWRRFSTTYTLESELGWTGVGIEALPWSCERTTSASARERASTTSS